MKQATRTIGDLGRRFGLGTDAESRLAILSSVLTDDPTAPTTIREPARVVDDHLADSLVALEIEAVRSARRIADLGAGAGVPGLPLAIALPDAEVSLVESNGRKCEFISRAITLCGLANAEVINRRVEAWEEGLRRFDIVTARALAAPAVVAEYAAPLLVIGGRLVAWVGRLDPADERSAMFAAHELGLDLAEARPVAPYPEAVNRNLLVFEKCAETPSRFPRRPGVARKRPLGRNSRAPV